MGEQCVSCEYQHFQLRSLIHSSKSQHVQLLSSRNLLLLSSCIRAVLVLIYLITDQGKIISSYMKTALWFTRKPLVKVERLISTTCFYLSLLSGKFVWCRCCCSGFHTLHLKSILYILLLSDIICIHTKYTYSKGQCAYCCSHHVTSIQCDFHWHYLICFFLGTFKSLLLEGGLKTKVIPIWRGIILMVVLYHAGRWPLLWNKGTDIQK